MASATARAPQPGNEEGRPVAGRPSDFVSSNNQEYTLDAYRVQRLISIAGISPALAAVSAPFVFGGASW
jgi:hypothetical protein